MAVCATKDGGLESKAATASTDELEVVLLRILPEVAGLARVRFGSAPPRTRTQGAGMAAHAMPVYWVRSGEH